MYLTLTSGVCILLILLYIYIYIISSFEFFLCQTRVVPLNFIKCYLFDVSRELVYLFCCRISLLLFDQG